MAKLDSLIHFTGTLQGLTRVKSRLYKDHVRTARKKGTPVNQAFQQSGKEIVRANEPAKLIKDAVDPYRFDFKCGKFWSRLVSLFKRQVSEGRLDFHALEGMELGADDPLSRFLTCRAVDVVPLQKGLRFVFEYDEPLFKKRLPYLTGYRLSLICLYLDKRGGKVASTLILAGPMNTLEDHPDRSSLSFEVPMPAIAGTVIFCLKGEGCEDGRVLSAPNTKGMRFVKVWEKKSKKRQMAKSKGQRARTKAKGKLERKESRL